jgi:tetratricopeptide (TPR) repeat protein
LSRLAPLLWPGLLAGLALALYLPFLGNALVFDDPYFFSGRNFARYATTPFGLELRLPAYFSLASVQVLWGDIRAHRLVSAALHVAVALTLYRLIVDLLRIAAPGAPARLAAFAAAAAFAVHPVAVYGAAYLVQRTGLLATLFALGSMAVLVSGAERRSYPHALGAAALFALAVMSKETSVLVPGAALALLLVLRPERGFGLRYGGAYLAACAPVALLAALLVPGKIATAYEPDFATIASQMSAVGAGEPGNPWLVSAATQVELFFRYLAYWLWPDTDAMSIDVRVELASGVPLALLAFLAWPALCAFLLLRRGRAAVAGFGLAYFWVVFLVELSTVRFADPFVLYRSYLWAPGLAIAAAALLAYRLAPVALLAALPLLALQAHDRLETFSSGLALWRDAAEKLPPHAIPGGSRILYQLGREHFYRGEMDEAVAAAERCIARYPGTRDCHMARASIHLGLGEHEAALPHLRRAAALPPRTGEPLYLAGMALEHLGRAAEAEASYRAALKQGFAGARFALERLAQPGKGLLPPTRSAAPPPG